MVALFEEGYPITGVSSDGRFSFSRDLTKTEKMNFDSFLNNNMPYKAVESNADLKDYRRYFY